MHFARLRAIYKGRKMLGRIIYTFLVLCIFFGILAYDDARRNCSENDCEGGASPESRAVFILLTFALMVFLAKLWPKLLSECLEDP
jgi:hypothetical protein